GHGAGRPSAGCGSPGAQGARRPGGRRRSDRPVPPARGRQRAGRGALRWPRLPPEPPLPLSDPARTVTEDPEHRSTDADAVADVPADDEVEADRRRSRRSVSFILAVVAAAVVVIAGLALW